jgi:hypothetical protein
MAASSVTILAGVEVLASVVVKDFSGRIATVPSSLRFLEKYLRRSGET